jgi:hypothetical protein
MLGAISHHSECLTQERLWDGRVEEIRHAVDEHSTRPTPMAWLLKFVPMQCQTEAFAVRPVDLIAGIPHRFQPTS